MCERELPFSRQTAFRLMSIAGGSRLTNVAHGQHLPPSWRTLYELTKLDDGQWQYAHYERADRSVAARTRSRGYRP
jgi:hypothetical protein